MLNLVRCRNISQINLILHFLFFFFLLFNLLLIRNIHINIIEVHIAKSRHIIHLHHIIIVNSTIINRIKCSLHTICTYINIIRHTNHLTGFTFRSSAYITYLFIFIITIVCIIYIITHLFSPFPHLIAIMYIKYTI